MPSPPAHRIRKLLRPADCSRPQLALSGQLSGPTAAKWSQSCQVRGPAAAYLAPEASRTHTQAIVHFKAGRASAWALQLLGRECTCEWPPRWCPQQQPPRQSWPKFASAPARAESAGGRRPAQHAGHLLLLPLAAQPAVPAMPCVPHPEQAQGQHCQWAVSQETGTELIHTQCAQAAGLPLDPSTPAQASRLQSRPCILAWKLPAPGPGRAAGPL